VGVTAASAVILSLLALMPGLVLCRATPLDGGRLGAIGAASLATTLFVTASLGAGVHAALGKSLPALALAPVALALTVGAWLATRGDRWARRRLDWPALILAAAFILWGVAVQRLATGIDADGALRIHAWYNADWFKHLGHVHALANYGVPARDIFADARPLHYYWLLYILPGAATALGGDAWVAMSVTNGLCAGLLMLTLYGVVRHAGANALEASVASGWAALACGPWQMWMAVFKTGGIAETLALPDQPPGPLFTSLALYIPQHALALTLLLGWAAVALASLPRRSERLLVLFGLATVMTISTLFGAGLLIAYGLTQLVRQRWQAVPELAGMVALVGVMILIVGVFQLGNPGSSMASPLMRDPVLAGTPLERGYQALSLVVRKNGLAFLAATVGWLWWRRMATPPQRRVWLFAGVMVGSALVLSSVTAALPAARVVEEFRMREINLLVVGVAIVGGWVLGHARTVGWRMQWLTWSGALALLIAALPGAVLLVLWHAQPGGMFTTAIPAQDRKAMAWLRAHSAAQDRVWQFPEKPFLADESGSDAWSVILAGRTSLATERATDYPAAWPMIDRAERYFRLEPVAIPATARWVYLSRALHPGSYDVLVARLGADRAWARRVCYADACLFERLSDRPI